MKNSIPDTCVPEMDTRSGWASKFEKQRCIVAACRPRVLLIGDSHASRWPKHLAWPGTAIVPGVVAHGGDKIQHILWRVERLDLASIRPETVVLFAGSNNCGFNKAEDIAAGIVKIANAIVEKVPRASVNVMSIPHRGQDFSRFKAKISHANSILERDLKRENVHFLAADQQFRAAAGGRNPSELSPDGRHYSEQGYLILCDIIRDLISPDLSH